MTASEILQKYLSFFEKRGHVQIPNSSLVPENDPTTLFTSSGMQPLVPYLLGEKHPSGTRLVNVQNSFRAQDIDEIGDNRHTTFFRMLGNWSLGDYFKKEQIPWFWEFLTNAEDGLGLDKNKLYISVFEGYKDIPKDTESYEIWSEVLKKAGLNPNERIFYYGVDKNWWSRSGVPDNMPVGEPGGPDTEVFYDLGTTHDLKFGLECHINCECGRYLEIGNSVFMQFKKTANGFEELPQKNVDFGGGLERLVAATEDKQDIFETSLFSPIVKSTEDETGCIYSSKKENIRIVVDHFIASVFIASSGIYPSNKEQGYILRRLVRRGLDNFFVIGGKDLGKIVEVIVSQYKETDPDLVEKFEFIKNTITEEVAKYDKAIIGAKDFLFKKYKEQGDEIKGVNEISAEDAFRVYTSYGLSPTQIKSLGFVFNDQDFAQKMEEHQKISRAGAAHKFAGGLADHSELTIKGHTATHLLHKAIRDMFGDQVHQAGSNITSERVRFDFNLDRKITPEEIKKLEDTVNEKIKENLPVHFEIMPLEKAKEIGAIGLFDEKYGNDVKVYFIDEYSKEFCGGPHVDFTGKIKRFKIIKEESLGRGMRRIYAKVE